MLLTLAVKEVQIMRPAMHTCKHLLTGRDTRIMEQLYWR